MTTSGLSRATVLAFAALLLLPAVSATVVVAPQALAQPGDLEQRKYVAVAAGNIDPNIGDLLVLTTADCDLVGCPRDIWFRFPNAPASVPTANHASSYAAEAAGNVAGGGCGVPAAADPLGCLRPDQPTPGFRDLPLATTSADETRAITDGRFVVYAAGPVNGPYDVWRFDARNPDDGAVLIAGSAADETPFGVAGDRIGVRVANGDGTATLKIVDLGPEADVTLDTVPATASAVLSATRAAWASGEDLFVYEVADAKHRTVSLASALATFSDLAISGDRLLYIEASEACTTGPSGNCNTHVTPPRKFTLKAADFTTVNAETGLPPTPTQVGTAISTQHTRPQRPVAFGVQAAWFTLDQSAATVERISMFEVPTNPPCAWSLGLAPGVLGLPAFSKAYITQLDFRAVGTQTCPVTNPGSNVVSYAMACVRGTSATRC